jgi:teichuronic acid biosynthesis glycosyltransferase TuaC
LDIENHVNFLGTVSHPEMLNQMAACDIFVLPSWNEALGVVYLEAMSFKKPVIGTIDEGISEIITDGKNGFLVSPKNIDSIVEKISMLINNKNLRETIGISGYESIKNMTWESNAKEMIKIYNEVKYN